MPGLELNEARRYYKHNQHTYAVLTTEAEDSALYKIFNVESGSFTGDWRWDDVTSVFQLVGISGSFGNFAPAVISPAAPDTSLLV